MGKYPDHKAEVLRHEGAGKWKEILGNRTRRAPPLEYGERTQSARGQMLPPTGYSACVHSFSGAETKPQAQRWRNRAHTQGKNHEQPFRLSAACHTTNTKNPRPGDSEDEITGNCFEAVGQICILGGSCVGKMASLWFSVFKAHGWACGDETDWLCRSWQVCHTLQPLPARARSPQSLNLPLLVHFSTQDPQVPPWEHAKGRVLAVFQMRPAHNI